MRTLGNISQSGILESKPIISSFPAMSVEVSVIFGNPKCNCENYGICKISEGFNLYNTLSQKNKAKAIITYTGTQVHLSILLNSILPDIKEYQFKNYSFNVITEYTLTEAILKSTSKTKFFIKPGIYTYRHKDIFKIPIEFEEDYRSYKEID